MGCVSRSDTKKSKQILNNVGNWLHSHDTSKHCIFIDIPKVPGYLVYYMTMTFAPCGSYTLVVSGGGGGGGEGIQ